MGMADTATAKHGTTYLWQPLDTDEIERQMREQGFVKGNVAVNVDDIIDGDLESFDDIISEALIGSGMLQEIGFKAVDVDDGNVVIFEVDGWVSDEDLDYL